ncbi:unnamed protein product [Gadus morhua 'NCC']
MWETGMRGPGAPERAQKCVCRRGVLRGGAPPRRRDVCRAASAFLLPRRFLRTLSPPGSGQVGPASPG